MNELYLCFIVKFCDNFIKVLNSPGDVTMFLFSSTFAIIACQNFDVVICRTIKAMQLSFSKSDKYILKQGLILFLDLSKSIMLTMRCRLMSNVILSAISQPKSPFLKTLFSFNSGLRTRLTLISFTMITWVSIRQCLG